MGWAELREDAVQSREAGGSVPFVLGLPGTLCAPSVFDPVARLLEGEAVIEAEAWLLGDGPWDISTVAERLAGDLRRESRSPVVVCGHSTGGAIALALTVAHPDLVAGLVLVGTGAHMRGHGDVSRILARVRDEWGEPLRAAVLDRSFAGPIAPEVRARLLAWSGQVSQQATFEVLESQRTLDLSPDLAAINVPVEVVHGRYDPTRELGQAQTLTDAIPGAVLTVLDTGHTPLVEDPPSVAAAVRRVVARRRHDPTS